MNLVSRDDYHRSRKLNSRVKRCRMLPKIFGDRVMLTIEADATVTEDGHMTLHVPTEVTKGTHLVRLTVLDNIDLPTPKRTFLGRPVYDEHDLRDIASDLPSEEQWAREEGIS